MTATVCVNIVLIHNILLVSFQALVHNPSMILHYTHIILDEIHERSTDADFALIIVRRLVANSSNLKVIIMSATMESNLIASYFEEMVNFTEVADPYFVGSKRYNVESYFIDELDRLADTKKSAWSDWQAIASSNLKELVLKQPQENLQEALTRKPFVSPFAQRVCTEVIISQANLGEQILVFLPGIFEIAEYYELLSVVLEARNLSDHFMIFVMHSQVPFEDQKEVFKPPPPCKTHVILATNIAESSITLPRLRLVINFGIYRQLEYDAKRHMSQLTKKWCSHASCAQRAGRAGRVFEGVAVHLFTRQFFWVIAPEFDPPEILHAPLAKLVLQAKQIGSKMGVPSPSEFLSQAIDPPSLEQMELALKELASFGAIVSQPGSPVLEEAEITLLGRFALTLPLDIEFSRLVLYSIFFGIPSDGIVIAAAASLSQDVFSLPTRMVMKEEAVYGDSLRRSMKSRYNYDGGEYSDAVMVCNMFREWIEHRNACCTDASLHVKHSFLRDFCNNHSVRWQRLLQLEHSIAEIASRVLTLIPNEYQLYEDVRALSDITSYRRGYSFMSDVEEDGEGGGRNHRKLRLCVVNLHFCEDVNIIKALVAAAFCHNFVLGYRGLESPVSKEKTESVQALTYMKHLGYNPAETIMFRSDQSATGVDVHNLVSTVLPRRCSEYRYIDRFWYVHLHPEFSTNPKTIIMRGAEQGEAKAASSNVSQGSCDSIISHKLSPDICYFWQYGERTPTWKVADATFSRPQHPCSVNWTRISKEKEKVIVQSWRNPSGLVCDLGRDCAPFVGIVSFLQGLQYRNAVVGRGVTILPSLSHGKEALLLLLAFQPQDVKISFVMNKGAITCLKIDSFSFPLPVALWRKISADDIVRINELRQAMSHVMRIDAEVVRRLPLEEISAIHSLLKCILTSTPSNLTCPTEKPSLPMTVREASRQVDGLIDSDDSEFEFDTEEMSTMDKDAGPLPLSSFQFYPPIECPLLEGCMVRPIPIECLESNYLFQKKTSHRVCGQAVGSSLVPLPSPVVRQETVGWDQIEEPDELEKLEQQNQQQEELLLQDHTFRLSPLAQPFVPKTSNFDAQLACPPPIASHSQQYQNMQGLSVQDEKALKSVEDLSLHNIHGFQNQNIHNLQDFPNQNVHNLQNFPNENVQNYSVVSEETPSSPSLLPVAATGEAGEVDMSGASYVVPESSVHPLLPAYSSVAQVNAQSVYLQSLLQIVENALQHPSASFQDMQQAKAICQYLLSSEVQTRQHLQSVGSVGLHRHQHHVGYPQEYRHYSIPRENNEPSSSAAVQTLQDNSTPTASENTYTTDNAVGFDKVKSSGSDAESANKNSDISQPGEEKVRPRPLRSPTTGLVEGHMEDEEESQSMKESQAPGGPATVEETSVQTEDSDQTKEMEEGKPGGKNTTGEEPKAEAAVRSDGEFKQSSLDQVASDNSSKLDTTVEQSSTNAQQSVIDHPTSNGEVQVQVEIPKSMSSLPVSIPSVCAPPVINSSVTVPPPSISSQTISRRADEPQIQRRLTKSDMSLNTTPAVVQSGHVYPVSQVLADRLSRLTQALLSPPRRSPSSIPLPLPLSHLVMPQQNRPSSAFLVPPRGPRSPGQLSPTAHHHSNPTLPGSSFNTAPIRPFHSSPSLANSCSSFVGSRTAFPNTTHVPHGTFPTANTVQLRSVVDSVPPIIQSPPGLLIPQPGSGVQRSESIAQVIPAQPQSPQRVIPQIMHVTGVAHQGGMPHGFVPRPPPVAHPINASSPVHGHRPHEREMSAKKQPHLRHHEPVYRYQGPPQIRGSTVHLPLPPGLGCPLPLPPLPPPSRHKRRGKAPPLPPPPPHPSLITNYTARHKIPPLIPALLPTPSSHHVHNHQASGLHVQPLKYNRRERESQKKPSYEMYGIPEETLVNCYCTMLSTKGTNLQLNLLCGPYYRDILKCFRICAKENELLDPRFFDHYSCFTVYGEPGKYMVKLNSVADIVEQHRKQQHHGPSNSDAPPTCEAPLVSDTAHATSDDSNKIIPCLSTTKAEPDATLSQSETTDATLTQPETTDVTLTQPETADDTLTQPETTGATLTQPETTDATLTHSETSLIQPDTTDALLIQPETTEPLLTQSETTDATLTHSETSLIQPDTTDALLIQPETTEPLLTQSETTDAILTQPETTDVTLTQPETTDVTLTHSETSLTQPDTTDVQPETTDALLIQLETTDALLTQPDNTVSKTSLAQPEDTDPCPETEQIQTDNMNILQTQAETTAENIIASLTQLDTTLTQHDTVVTTLIHPTLETQPETVVSSDSFQKNTPTQPDTTDASLAQPETTLTRPETTDAQPEISVTSWSVVEPDIESTSQASQNNLEAGAPTIVSAADKENWDEEERESMQLLDDTLVPGDTAVQVASESEEVEISIDQTLVLLTAPSSQTTGEGAIKEDWEDGLQLAVSGSISGEDRPSSVASFDEDCWVESGYPEVYSAPESSTSTLSRPEPKTSMSSTGYDEDCWQEGTPPECVSAAEVPFRPIRILKREDSGQKPFDTPRDQHKPPIGQSYRRGTADSDGGKTSKDEQSQSEEFKRRKKSKSSRNKRKSRNMREERRGDRYSPTPLGSNTSSGRTGERRSVSRDRDRGERREENQRYGDNGRQRFGREGPRNQPRRAEGESKSSDEGGRKNPTREFRRGYGPYGSQKYGAGWRKEKEQSAQK